MIPWVREKFAERRAKWLAARSKRSNAKSEDDDDSSTTTSEAAPRFHRLQDNPEALEERVTRNVPNSPRPHHRHHTTSTTSNSTHSSSAFGLARHHQRQISSHNHHHHHHHHHHSHHQNSSPPLQQSPQPCHHASRSLHSSPVKIAKVKGSRRSSEASSSINNLDDNAGGSKERVKVRVICPSARVLSFQSDTNKRLMELKNEIILELADDLADMPLFATDVRTLANKFRLVRAEYQGIDLNENKTLEELELSNNDALILVPKRTYLQQVNTQTQNTRTTSEVEIDVATRNIEVQTSDLPMVDINEIFQQSNLQFDVRKVLISLAQASAVVIGSGPYASRLIFMLKQKLINKRNYQNDTLQCLVDMGFKRERAEYALKLHNNVYSTALEWLIQRQSEDATIEEAVMGIPRTSSISSPSAIISNDGPVDNVAALLEIIRIYSYRDIPPTSDAVQALVEMGFKEPDVIQALKKTCNNKAAACEWLCGNRTGSLVELREGLAQDSPILKTILELPQVQLNLSNPKILLAFLAILENEHTIRVWGGDNDTTSVITHILQKYHEEKHVLGINQFYGDR